MNVLHEDYVLCHRCHGEVNRFTGLAVDYPPTCYTCWAVIQELGGEG